MIIKNKKDFASGFCLFFLGLFLVFQSSQLLLGVVPAAGYFPLIIAVLMIGLSLLIIIKSLALTRGQEHYEVPVKQGKNVVNVFRVSSSAILITLYGISIEKLGFLMASTVFLILMLKYVEEQSWRIVVFVGVTSIIVSYTLFAYFLGVPLPKGFFK